MWQGSRDNICVGRIGFSLCQPETKMEPYEERRITLVGKERKEEREERENIYSSFQLSCTKSIVLGG